MLKNKIVVIFILILVLHTHSFAEIEFTDGVWSTTFDCTAVSQPTLPSCDGVIGWGGGWGFKKYTLTDGVSNNWIKSTNGTTNEWYYNSDELEAWTFGESRELLVGEVGGVRYEDTKPGPPYGVSYPPGELVAESWGFGDDDTLGFDTAYIYSTTDPDLEPSGQVRAYFTHNGAIAGDSKSSITSDANNPDGLGGNGFRTLDGDGSGIDTAPIQIDFPEAQKELWIRWYMKHEEDYEWYAVSSLEGNRIPEQQKHVYLYTVPTGTQVIAQFVDYEYSLTAQSATTIFPMKTTGNLGWPTIMGVPVTGGGADGIWHCYEFHVKMNSATGVADGEGHIWLDGELKKSNLAVNWSGTLADSLPGWTYFKLGENQAKVDNSGVVRSLDFDDLVVSTVGYIGPIVTPSSSGTTKNGFGSGKWGR